MSRIPRRQWEAKHRNTGQLRGRRLQRRDPHPDGAEGRHQLPLQHDQLLSQNRVQVAQDRDGWGRILRSTIQRSVPVRVVGHQAGLHGPGAGLQARPHLHRRPEAGPERVGG